MNTIVKFIIISLIGYISINSYIVPLLFRKERNNQENFLLEFFNIKQIESYYSLLNFQDKILEKKTYIIPEISIKISCKKEKVFIKRFIIPLQFNLINNCFFDEGINLIFKSLNIGYYFEDMSLKANILEEIEKLIKNDSFKKNGDIILGYDLDNNKNKIYFDTNNDYISSYEWNNQMASDNLLYREYKFTNDLTILDKFLENNFNNQEKIYITELFNLYKNLDKILYRIKYKKSSNYISDDIDSLHINFKDYIIIDDKFIKLFKKFLSDINCNEDLFCSKIIDKEIHWISLNQGGDINIYIRYQNNIDKLLNLCQLPFHLLSNNLYK